MNNTGDNREASCQQPEPEVKGPMKVLLEVPAGVNPTLEQLKRRAGIIDPGDRVALVWSDGHNAFELVRVAKLVAEDWDAEQKALSDKATAEQSAAQTAWDKAEACS